MTAVMTAVMIAVMIAARWLGRANPMMMMMMIIMMMMMMMMLSGRMQAWRWRIEEEQVQAARTVPG